MSLPQAAIKEDHRLENQASSASEDLARHRWHWTLNTDNPKRVPTREYARAVGRTKSVIEGQAKGYANWVGGLAGEAGLSEAIERAKMSTEKAAVTEAISEARGTSFKNTRMTRSTEIRRVREIARERAEKHGTDVAEEAKKVAEVIVRSEKAEKAAQEDRATRMGLRFIEVEGYLKKAMSALTAALNASHHVDWGQEERELLTDTIARVKDLLGLVDVSIAGMSEVDWDAELARIMGGAA